MNFDANLKAHLDLVGRLYARAAAYPGPSPATSGDVQAARAELRLVCDWLVQQQNDQGLWVENGVNLRFYSDAYAVRGLLAGWRLLDEPCFRDAACRWMRYVLNLQRADGGWWVGYSAGDHDYDAPDADQTVVYTADAGEVSLALINAVHTLSGDKDTDDLARQATAALIRFRDFCEMFRLRSGGMGLGYTRRNFYCHDRKQELPYMQAHHLPWMFATAITGVNTYAGLFSLTGDATGWDMAMTSLDWVLDHVAARHDPAERSVPANDASDFTMLMRVMDWTFACCSEPMDEAGRIDPTPEPRFASPQRQKLYAIWKQVMHRLVDRQSELGEWPVYRGDQYLARYDTPLRHRLLFSYALSTYLGCMGNRNGEDDRLAEAMDRQLWLAGDEHIRQAHYGVCVPSVHMMPSGLWAMIQAERIQPGVTLPNRGHGPHAAV